MTGQVIRSSKQTATRYERDRPGELVHVDVKKTGKIPAGGGWRAHGRSMGSTAARKKARIGYDYVHSMVDDHSRLAYSEILPDEKGPTCGGFIQRAAAYFAAHGITSIERVITTNHDRAAALAPWLEHYNTERRHSALGSHPPISRLLPT
jgi:transposase InsO family protein